MLVAYDFAGSYNVSTKSLKSCLLNKELIFRIVEILFLFFYSKKIMYLNPSFITCITRVKHVIHKMDKTLLGSLSNAHCFPSNKNILTYNVDLQC